jgi:hypothetical protein
VIDKVFGDGITCGHKEGSSRQEVQEPGIANHAPLDHPIVVYLKHCFFSTTEKDELYLNLVLEYVPESWVIRHYNKMNQKKKLRYCSLLDYYYSFITIQILFLTLCCYFFFLSTHLFKTE